MAMKIKGIYKSFKFIYKIFDVKEREMEIGYPTDVKHVSHVGLDSSNITGPSWMNEFRTSPNFATSSFGKTGEPSVTNSMSLTTTWSNQGETDKDYEPVRGKSTSINNSSYSDHHNNNASKKNNKSGKSKSTPSSRSYSSSSTKGRSRAPKSKLTFSEATPTLHI